MAAAAVGVEAPLCDYELQRLERIKRNRQVRRGCSHCTRVAAARLRTRCQFRLGANACCVLTPRDVAQIMEALGLFDEDVALAAQMRAAGSGGGKAGSGGKGGESKASRKRAADSSPAQPQRRSQRVAGLVRAAAHVCYRVR